MTAQIPERLLHRGRELSMCETPLDPLLTKMRKARRPQFLRSSTACHRGYVGSWEIRDGALYLIHLEGWMRSGDDVVDATLASALRRGDGPILADWFSGEAVCPEGRLLSYVHHMFCSSYERDRIFWFDRGRLEREFLRINPPLPLLYLIAPDGTRTCIEDMGEPQAVEDPFPPDQEPVGHVYFGRPPIVEPGDDDGYMLGGYATFPIGR